MTFPLFIFGASGVAREVKELFEDVQRDASIGEYSQLKFESFVGIDAVNTDLQIRDYISEEQFQSQIPEIGYFLLGIGTGQIREKAKNFAKAHGLKPITLIHPRAYFGASSLVTGEGTTIGVFTSVTSNVEIGSFCFIDRNITIGHDTLIGDFVSIYPSASISGNVVIEDGATIGTGARILQGITVGRGSFVGAGAVVTKDVAPGVVVAGVPAKEMHK